MVKYCGQICDCTCRVIIIRFNFNFISIKKGRKLHQHLHKNSQMNSLFFALNICKKNCLHSRCMACVAWKGEVQVDIFFFDVWFTDKCGFIVHLLCSFVISISVFLTNEVTNVFFL